MAHYLRIEIILWREIEEHWWFVKIILIGVIIIIKKVHALKLESLISDKFMMSFCVKSSSYGDESDDTKSQKSKDYQYH